MFRIRRVLELKDVSPKKQGTGAVNKTEAYELLDNEVCTSLGISIV